MKNSITIKNAFSWFLMILFINLDIMNLILIHPVPGIFYILFSFLYFPPLAALAAKRLGFSIPYILKIIAAFILLWGTLAVGDLAELYGF